VAEKKPTVGEKIEAEQQAAAEEAQKEAERAARSTAGAAKAQFDDSEYSREQLIQAAQPLFGVPPSFLEVAIRRFAEQKDHYRKAEVNSAVKKLANTTIEEGE
jgi:hypothetical protein